MLYCPICSMWNSLQTKKSDIYFVILNIQQIHGQTYSAKMEGVLVHRIVTPQSGLACTYKPE